MTKEQLLHDYYTTCTDIDIDRYTYTHTHIHTYTQHTHNTHTIHTHTHTATIHTQHTHIHTHNTHTHTHIHTQHKKRRTTLQQKCVVQQEATNYVAAEVRRAARSGELRSCGPKVTGGKRSEAPSKAAAPEI
jgi:hypothetical protein